MNDMNSVYGTCEMSSFDSATEVTVGTEEDCGGEDVLSD
jgi:hypothetical protein